MIFFLILSIILKKLRGFTFAFITKFYLLQGVAHRVCLGLIPSSECSWATAVTALR